MYACLHRIAEVLRECRWWRRSLGALLLLPMVVAYVVSVFCLAALVIELTDEPVYEVQADKLSPWTDGSLVELKVEKLRGRGKINLPDIGEIDEWAVFARYKGEYFPAPRITCGCWELKFKDEQIRDFAGKLGVFGRSEDGYEIVHSPAVSYDDSPTQLVGRQRGKVIEVNEIAEFDGHYKNYMQMSVPFFLLTAIFVLAVVIACAVYAWFYHPYSLQSFRYVALISMGLELLPAGLLVSFGVVVHAAQAAVWGGPLAVVLAAGIVIYSVCRLRMADNRPSES